MKKIAVLTSGGDAPGMNAAIRGVTRTAIFNGMEVIGIRHGYHGMIYKHFTHLKAHSVSDILAKGGTILKTARSKEFMTEEGRKQAYENLKEEGIDAVVVIALLFGVDPAVVLDGLGSVPASGPAPQSDSIRYGGSGGPAGQQGDPFAASLERQREDELADFVSVILADTEDNQAAYPQPRSQKPGLGFPICRVVGLFCLASGALLDAATAPCEGKGSDEQTLLRGLLDRLAPDDILLGDNGLLDYTWDAAPGGADTDRDSLDLIETTAQAGGSARGGVDYIFGNAGGDTAFGGSAGDRIIGDNDESTDGSGDADTYGTVGGVDILVGDQGLFSPSLASKCKKCKPGRRLSHFLNGELDQSLCNGISQCADHISNITNSCSNFHQDLNQYRYLIMNFL